MPIYDYQCTSCGHKAEVMRKISAASTEACPECGAETFSKQLSAPSFQLSGSGWYATDFKNGSKPAPETKSETSTEKKSEVAAPAACATGCACH
jgi:putative FmdB family regulatory protein